MKLIFITSPVFERTSFTGLGILDPAHWTGHTVPGPVKGSSIPCPKPTLVAVRMLCKNVFRGKYNIIDFSCR